MFADRVRETSSTTGTGTLDLGGAPAGHQTFLQGIGTTKQCYYLITDNSDWELGIGTVTGGTPDTLSRQVVLESSNGDSLVNWGVGTKTVMCVAPASTLGLSETAHGGT